MNKTEDWFNIRNSLSYNLLYILIVGGRSIGKTFSTKVYLINLFLKKKHKFVFVAKTRDEAKAMGDFFNEVSHLKVFANVKFEYKTESKMRFCYINGEQAGVIVVMTQLRLARKYGFSGYKTLVLDEFINPKGIRYLPNEYSLFMDIVSSVMRPYHGIQIIMLSNAASLDNPYFKGFNIMPDPNKRFNVYKNKNLLVEFPPDKIESFGEDNLTDFEKSLIGTEYGNYALSNKFSEDDDHNIMKKTKFHKPLFNFISDGERISLWYDASKNTYIFSFSYDETVPESRTFLMNWDNVSDEGTFFKWSDYSILIKKIENNSGIYFDSIHCKSLGTKILKRIGVIP